MPGLCLRWSHGALCASQTQREAFHTHRNLPVLYPKSFTKDQPKNVESRTFDHLGEVTTYQWRGIQEA